MKWGHFRYICLELIVRKKMVFGKALEDRDLKRQLVLVTLTACDCEEQVEILSRGNREASFRV